MSLKHLGYRVFQKGMKIGTSVLDWTPPKVIKGAGAIKKLPAVVKSEGVSNVLVVTDKGLMGLHLLDSLFEGLESEGIEYSVFDGVQPNPTIYNVEDALKIYKENNCQGFIAFGGGSPMDCAKVTAARVVR
ncbi:MAG: iron-containing alcohol dehydrogenase, partial [Acutalibacteraceae bacterium]